MECSKFGKSFIILIILAFTAAIGVILLFIGCAMGFERAIAGEHTVNWWGLLVCVFYLMSPVPLAIARCCSIKECMPEEYLRILYDLCYFTSACIVISGFGFPLVLARKSLIEYGAFGLISGANIFVFSTVYAFFGFFTREEEWDWTSDNW